MCTSASVANFFKHIFHTIQCRENYQAMHIGATMNSLSVMHEEIWSLSYQKLFQLHIPLIFKLMICPKVQRKHRKREILFSINQA